MADKHSELELVTQNLSITTLRYIPENLELAGEKRTAYLNTLNETLVTKLQEGGELFLSNAIVKEHYCMRACIVNFRTTKKDIEESIAIIVKEGLKTHKAISGY